MIELMSAIQPHLLHILSIIGISEMAQIVKPFGHSHDVMAT